MASSKIKTATLGGTVWDDKNHDGIQNDGNIGVAGVKVRLMYLDGNGRGITKTTVSDADGNYSFSGLKPGEYIVKFDKAGLPDGATFTQKDVGNNNNIDSDINAQTGITSKINLHAGEVNTSVDAGVVLPTQPEMTVVNGHVWKDDNANGIQDTGEASLEGAIVTVTDSSQITTSTTTDSNGNYSLLDITPGSYVMTIDGGVEYNRTTLQNQGNNESLDSDLNQALYGETTITVQAGMNQDIDAGLIKNPHAIINGHVWVDDNANGIQDSGEAGLPGAAVNLYIPSYDGNPIMVVAASAKTDANGNYSIDVVPGSYTLAVDGGPQYNLSTLQNQGNDDSLDSDVNQAFHGSTTITVQSGVNPVIDAGLIKNPPVHIEVSKGVWLDNNPGTGDQLGVKDSDEAGVAGVTVTVSSAGADGVAFTSDDVVQASTVTNANGDYAFDLSPGFEYNLTFTNIGAGRQFTIPNVGEPSVGQGGALTILDVATDSDVIDSSGHAQSRPYHVDGDPEGSYISAGLVDIVGTAATVPPNGVVA